MDNKEKKLLGVLTFFYPHRGGSQKYAEELYFNLMQQNKKIKIDVLCYDTDNTGLFESYRGMNIYRVPCYHIVRGSFVLPKIIPLLRMLVKLRYNNYSYINTHIRFFDPTWWVCHYAKFIGAKSIFSGHVASHPRHKSRFVTFIAYCMDKTIAKFSLRFYDQYTFENKAAADFFSKELGVKQGQIVYGGVDTSFFSPDSENSDRCICAHRQIYASPNETVVTYIGRLSWTKGISFFVEAIREFIDRDDIRFVIAGPGDLRTCVPKNLFHKVSDRVTLTGDLDYVGVRDLLRATDIFINPSHHSEGLPLTILEAGSTGCYVIATDNAGTREVIQDGITGALVPQKSSAAIVQAIRFAVSNPEIVKKNSSNLRELIVNRHDWREISRLFYLNTLRTLDT